jgi:thiol-disulfide isomerase/thioredoxin
VNPALPGGASGTDAGPDDDRWSASARAAYTYVPYGRLQQGTRTAPNPSGLEIDVHLGTLQLQAAAPTGTALDLQLPFGSLTTRTIDARRTDPGVGDLELRVRQSAGRWVERPQLAVAIGAVLPTGPYVAHSGAANLAPEASYLTLGRGVAWWIAEADARIAVHRRASIFGQVSARGPLARASDGFAWGAEARATAGARAVAITDRLAFVVASDLQWRDGASEPDPFSGGRLASANAGGWQWLVSPAAVVELGGGVSASVGARIPLQSDVVGNQLVPQTGGFAAVSYAPRLEPRRSAARYQPPPGRITVVDYWATWCAPCIEISRQLEGAAKRWPDVRIVSIDASRWPDDDAPPLPRGAGGLPVIEIFVETGARLALLVGPDALRVVERVDALRARRSSTTGEAP